MTGPGSVSAIAIPATWGTWFLSFSPNPVAESNVTNSCDRWETDLNFSR